MRGIGAGRRDTVAVTVCVWQWPRRTSGRTVRASAAALAIRTLGAAVPPASLPAPVGDAAVGLRHAADGRRSPADQVLVAAAAAAAGRARRSCGGVAADPGRRLSGADLHGPLGGAGARRRARGATTGCPARLRVHRQGESLLPATSLSPYVFLYIG